MSDVKLDLEALAARMTRLESQNRQLRRVLGLVCASGLALATAGYGFRGAPVIVADTVKTHELQITDSQNKIRMGLMSNPCEIQIYDAQGNPRATLGFLPAGPKFPPGISSPTNEAFLTLTGPKSSVNLGSYDSGAGLMFNRGTAAASNANGNWVVDDGGNTIEMNAGGKTGPLGTLFLSQNSVHSMLLMNDHGTSNHFFNLTCGSNDQLFPSGLSLSNNSGTVWKAP